MASSQSISDLHRHERFYFSDGSLHLLVDNTLYCVHGSLFEIHASKFPVRGVYSSSNPCVLEDVKQIDFDRLLACFYPRALLVKEAKTSGEWMSILKLATKWGFESLRSIAMRKIKRKLNTPVDMVAFGRQYDIPDILLSGYVALCRSNVPLTYEEGLCLDTKDLIDIYRIRYELYGPNIMPVSFEEATAKVKAFISVEGRKDDAEAETTEKRDASFDDDQHSVWTDIESVKSPQALYAGDDRELEAVSIADTDLRPSEMAMTIDVENLGGSMSKHSSSNAFSMNNAPGSHGDDSQSTLQDVPNMSESSQGPQLFDELTMDNFDVVSIKILQWVNANDSQTLYHATSLMVNKAVESHGQTDVCVLLCKKMIQKVSGKIHDSITKKSKRSVATGGSLFREHLGEVCRKKLEGVTTSVAAAFTRIDDANFDSLPEVIQRVRLIKFIGQLSDLMSEALISRDLVDKWIATLLDAQDTEKLVTLSMLLDSAGPRWDVYSRKLKARMNNCFVEMTKIAQTTYNARLRTLLQNVIERRNKGWAVNEIAEDNWFATTGQRMKSIGPVRKGSYGWF